MTQISQMDAEERATFFWFVPSFHLRNQRYLRNLRSPLGSDMQRPRG
jgi:hypothetical protein